MRVKQIFLLLIGSWCFRTLNAQNSFSCLVKDTETGEPLPSVSVVFNHAVPGFITNSDGKLDTKTVPDGKAVIQFSIVGYKTFIKELNFPLPKPDSVYVILLERDIKEEEQVVIVASSRTESGIENLPTKVEVLGAEEVNEEVGIKPGNIASLLGDVAGIQIQQTSATTGNVEMRVQGLPGKYTQLLKDGMPLFGGYSGSFSILQIPPLDLKQIELVKGASSTLYGGGAIAGMINLISKRPKEGVYEKTILVNQSTLRESNINFYFSGRNKKTGLTLFSGANIQQAADVNKDGFSDLPKTRSFFFHPTLFIYPDQKNMIYFGYSGTFENREGGDMLVIRNRPDNIHQYFTRNKSNRHTADFFWENKLNAKDRLTLKGTSSWFDRKIETNIFGMDARQLSYFSEFSYLKKWERTDLVAGLNLTGEDFRKKLPDSTRINNYSFHTIGFFVQNDWRATSKFIIQTGFRYDHHNHYGDFALPRISLLYKISSLFSTRLGSGFGYQIPTLFSSELDERDYPALLPFQQVKAEKSVGANWDLNYHQKVNGWDLTVNQALFSNRISHPIIQVINGLGEISFINASSPITTKGLETYIQVIHDELEIYLGYIYTSAKRLYDTDHPDLDLIAKNKFASIVAYEFSEHLRAGIESALTGKQYLDDGSRTPGYLFMAAMIRYDVGKFSFVLNCENLLDYRQTRKETILIPPPQNPGFKQLWAPIDGRVVNFSVRTKL